MWRLFGRRYLVIPDGTISNPASAMIDFEKGAINSFTAHFPQADVCGCCFHLGQSGWRRIQGLAAKYREEPAFALRVQRLFQFTFVPPAQVHDYMAMVIADEAPEHDAILEFIQYI